MYIFRFFLLNMIVFVERSSQLYRQINYSDRYYYMVGGEVCLCVFVCVIKQLDFVVKLVILRVKIFLKENDYFDWVKIILLKVVEM